MLAEVTTSLLLGLGRESGLRSLDEDLVKVLLMLINTVIPMREGGIIKQLRKQFSTCLILQIKIGCALFLETMASRCVVELWSSNDRGKLQNTAA